MDFRSPALPAQTAGGSTSTTYVGTFEPADATGLGVSRVVITPPAGYTTVTGVATNNVTFNVRQLRAGSAVSTFASLTLNSGTNLVAETPVSVPISSQPALQPDDEFDVQMVQNGTGLAVGAGLFISIEVN